jgi:methylenetetrahydrofolate reductase (NADPH)
MTRIDDIIKQSSRSFSLELLPPEQFSELEEYLEKIDAFAAYNPAFFTVTYHQAQIKIIKEDRVKRVVEKHDRVGSDRTATALQWRYLCIPAVPHFICGDFTKEETERSLVQLPPYGVENVMCLRGDPNHSRVFIPNPHGHAHASDLVRQVRAMEHGEYVKERDIEPFQFCIGVAGYPECHHESPNLDVDIRWAVHKIREGANFLITQMCFDTDSITLYRDLLHQELQKESLEQVPIVPGLKIAAHLGQFSGENGLPSRFGVRIPSQLIDRMEKYTSKADQLKVGQEWAVMQAEALYAEDFPLVHIYTLNRPNIIAPVLDALGFGKKTT